MQPAMANSGHIENGKPHWDLLVLVSTPPSPTSCAPHPWMDGIASIHVWIVVDVFQMPLG